MLILNIYIKKEVILFPESCILLEYINLLGGEDSRSWRRTEESLLCDS